MSRLRQIGALLVAVGAENQDLAAQPGDQGAGIAAAACAGCGGFLIVIIALFALQIALLVWVARDAKSRGMDSAVIWMLFVFVVPVIGLIVYLFSRPQGALTRCPHCNNSRLQASAKCPHCGHA